MNPSSFSTSSRRARSLDAGQETLASPRNCPLRILARRSPIGSLMAIPFAPLPARLGHAGDLAKICEIPKRDARKLQFSVVAFRAAAEIAAIVHATGRRVARQLCEFEPCSEALFRRDRKIFCPRFQRHTFGGV